MTQGGEKKWEPCAVYKEKWDATIGEEIDFQHEPSYAIPSGEYSSVFQKVQIPTLL